MYGTAFTRGKSPFLLSRSIRHGHGYHNLLLLLQVFTYLHNTTLKAWLCGVVNGGVYQDPGTWMTTLLVLASATRVFS